MNKTNIDWATHCWNPVIGCRRGCPYCYAKKINDRFHLIPDFSIPTWREGAFSKPMPRKPARIFVNSMSDICYWSDWELSRVVARCEYECLENTGHIFIFLTKDCSVYDRIAFPSNCWLGVSDTGNGEHVKKFYTYQDNKFVSFEPLLADPEPTFNFYVNHGIKWVIVGGLTPKPAHKKEWVDKIVEWTRAARLPLFIKSNLHYPVKIQEYPKG